MAKNTGKVREKSGNFVSPEKWEPCPGTKVHRNTSINFFCEVESTLKSHMLFGNCYGDACITKTHVYNKLIYLQWC